MTGKHGTGSSRCVLTESNSKHCNNERSNMAVLLRRWKVNDLLK